MTIFRSSGKSFEIPPSSYSASGTTNINGIKWDFQFLPIDHHYSSTLVNLLLQTADGRKVSYQFTHNAAHRLTTLTSSGVKTSWSASDFEQTMPIMAVAIKDLCEYHAKVASDERRRKQQAVRNEKQRQNEKIAKEMLAPIDQDIAHQIFIDEQLSEVQSEEDPEEKLPPTWISRMIERLKSQNTM